MPSCLRLCFGVNSIDSTTAYTIQKRMTSFMTGVKEEDLFGELFKKFDTFLHARKYLL